MGDVGLPKSKKKYRCAYSAAAKRMLKPRHADRLGYASEISPWFCAVVWDGTKTRVRYARKFIDLQKDQQVATRR